MSKLVNQSQGIGMGYRPELRQFILNPATPIDVLEITPEHYIEAGELLYHQELAALRERFKLVLHGVTANLVSMAEPNWRYFAAIKQLLKLTGSPYFSDHMALTASDGFQVGFFCPNNYNQGLLTRVIDKIKRIEDFLETPIVLEYIAYSMRIPDSPWTAEEFFLELTQQYDRLGILLDLSNVWYNSLNFGFDCWDFINALPHDRIVHAHLAGGEQINGFWHDSHSTAVHPEVFELFSQLTQKSAIDCIIIERDANYTTAQHDLINDIQQARKLWSYTI